MVILFVFAYNQIHCHNFLLIYEPLCVLIVTNHIQRSSKLQAFLCVSFLSLLSIDMRHVELMKKNLDLFMIIYFNESKNCKHNMQDVMFGDDFYAIKMHDLR